MDVLQYAPLVAEYRRLQALVATHGPGPGRTTTLGWDLEFAAADSLPSFLDQIVFRRMNDFVAAHDAPVILDCGANIGYTTLHYKRRYPRARITAFEPDPQFAPLLRRNLARNGAADVRVVEAAAWTADGTAPWIMEGRDGSRLAAPGDGSTSVATVDLASYLTETDVDLLKLDVEGAEFALVPHLAGRLARVRSVLVEVHVTGTKDQVALGGLLTTLSDAGFDVALNSFGPWRDLIRRHTPPPLHAEQYLVLAGWRPGSTVGVSTEPSHLPYLGLDTCAELYDAAMARRLQPQRAQAAAVLADVARGSTDWDVRRLDGFERESGHCWTWRVPPDVVGGDGVNGPGAPTLLLEDGRLLGPWQAIHDEIRACGGGRYSHWGRDVYLSTSDNSCPNDNGRTYTLVTSRRVA